MKYYLIVYDRLKYMIKAETMIYANDFYPIALDFIRDRKTIASFKKWDYWIELTEDEYDEMEIDKHLDEHFKR